MIMKTVSEAEVASKGLDSETHDTAKTSEVETIQTETIPTLILSEYIANTLIVVYS